MNATSAVSIAFDPLLPWWVLAVLGGIGQPSSGSKAIETADVVFIAAAFA